MPLLHTQKGKLRPKCGRPLAQGHSELPRVGILLRLPFCRARGFQMPRMHLPLLSPDGMALHVAGLIPLHHPHRATCHLHGVTCCLPLLPPSDSEACGSVGTLDCTVQIFTAAVPGLCGLRLHSHEWPHSRCEL